MADVKAAVQPVETDGEIPRPLYAASTMPDINSSVPLLRLPAELRNAIYELVLGRHIIEIDAIVSHSIPPILRGRFYKQHKHQQESSSKRATSSRFLRTELFLYRLDCSDFIESRYVCRLGRTPVNLLRTCRKIANEARPILYTSNTFAFRSAPALTTFAWHCSKFASRDCFPTITRMSLFQKLSEYDYDDTEEMDGIIAAILTHCPLVDALFFVHAHPLGFSRKKSTWRHFCEEFRDDRKLLQEWLGTWISGNQDERQSPVVKALLEVASG